MKCEVVNIRNQKDGSALADVEWDEEFGEFALEWAKKERMGEIVEMFVLQSLKDGMKEKDV
jgi:hypothetical protein